MSLLLVFRECSTGPACQCLFETLALDSHACPRRFAFETRKCPHSGHQVPKQLPIILEKGRSKPSLRYPKGSVHPPRPSPNPPPPKKTQIFGTSSNTLSPKCFMHLARFSGQPQKFGITSKLRKKVGPKIPPFFFRGSIKVRLEIPCLRGRRAVSLGHL